MSRLRLVQCALCVALLGLSCGANAQTPDEKWRQDLKPLVPSRSALAARRDAQSARWADRRMTKTPRDWTRTLSHQSLARPLAAAPGSGTPLFAAGALMWRGDFELRSAELLSGDALERSSGLR